MRLTIAQINMHAIPRKALLWAKTATTSVVCLALIVLSPAMAYAHQPFFEDTDATASNPWRINDPSISLALYGTLQSAADIDYFAMSLKRGQRVPIQMTVPQINGQAAGFAPSLALIGPGLGQITITLGSSTIVTYGLLLVAPANAGKFYESFSGDYYWTWQATTLSAPQTGDYRIWVWHAKGCVGRYTLAVGSREVRGGDPDFRTKKIVFWTPVSAKSVATCDL